MVSQKIIPKTRFMQAAIKLAQRARKKGDYAIGAVVVKDNRIVSRGLNSVKIKRDSTQHAEIVAMQQACRRLKSRFLSDSILYTTHEPCAMCASAAVWCKLGGIVSGSTLSDMLDFAKRKGNTRFTWRTIKIRATDILRHGNPRVPIVEKFMRNECIRLFHTV